MGRENLVMKPVGVEYLKQYNQLLRYVFQVTDRDLRQSGWDEETEFIRAKSPTMQKADVIGWFDKDKLISQVAVYPMHVRIFDHTYSMGGLTGVGTYPEYANRGLMHDLLCQALCRMRERRQYISYLFPYSIPFYRRKGWEIISDKIHYEIMDYQLPKNRPMEGEVRRVDYDSEVLKKTYRRFAMQTHGALLRDELAWNEYWLWDPDDLMAAVYYNRDGEPDGYLIYWIADDVFHIKDMIFLNEYARTCLWNFVSAHLSMIEKVIGDTFTDEPLSFLLEDADIKESISPYFMARIVDFEKFIAEYPFKPDTVPRRWVFDLEDPLLPWNTGRFALAIDEEGHGSAERTEEETADRLDVQTMVTMLLGYKRPEYLRRIRRLVCSEETVEMLEDALGQQVSYFSDYF